MATGRDRRGWALVRNSTLFNSLLRVVLDSWHFIWESKVLEHTHQKFAKPSIPQRAQGGERGNIGVIAFTSACFDFG